jgi:hypothetical protein
MGQLPDLLKVRPFALHPPCVPDWYCLHFACQPWLRVIYYCMCCGITSPKLLVFRGPCPSSWRGRGRVCLMQTTRPSRRWGGLFVSCRAALSVLGTSCMPCAHLELVVRLPLPG